MKNIVLSLVAFMFIGLSTTCFAEGGGEEFDITKMTNSELIAYQAMKRKQKESAPVPVEKYTKYAEIGKAFGSAFKECWTTVSDDAERFAQSDAGKLAMFLVAWKIMGKDAISVTKSLVRWAVGGSMLFIGILVWVKFWRNAFFPILVKTERTGIFTVHKTYERNPNCDDGAMKIVYILSLLIWMIASVLIAFAGS